MILISSCLAGLATRYDGGDNYREEIARLLREGKAVLVCPEQLGGLPTPRPPAEIVGGGGDDVLEGRARVVTNGGEDVTAEFVRGAEQTLKTAQTAGARYAVLKESSPSCGSTMIYDGTYTRTKEPGFGVTTALLRRHGIEVYSENNVGELLKKLEWKLEQE
ncbi:DUF523 domain-containing protein [Paenibacillus caseinilyticus]|uniref:Uncharacterized protein n=1 Tax=Paenibacillus mucilaginosus K02 TaxID=997761 RepID=I0BNP1_9BACL|nr:DUF523 domain-containing protein [Paenibacillus mucilaginosus]AFH63988.1 hypothetical protein B2K_25440 [Paenibacillus mucilaginosus K02]